MNMKEHILAALREQFERWEEVLAGLSEAQRTGLTLPSGLSVKDDMAHLSTWQQRSIARVEAARLERAPELPTWVPGVEPDSEGATDQINAWIYETHRDRPWPEVHRQWREGFLRFLDLGEKILERDLLDSDRYPWLEGHPLAFVFVASYDHHQEHLEKLLDWLRQPGAAAAGTGGDT